jgi:CRISPR-associated protein Cas1
LSIEFSKWLEFKLNEKKPKALAQKSDKIKSIWNQEMATLYLMEQGSYLQKEHQRFIVQISQSQKIELLIREIEIILVFGNIQLTTSAIKACLQDNILVLFLSQTGQYNGHLWNLEYIHLSNEIRQIEQQKNLAFKLQIAKEIISGKLLNSRQLLLRLNRRRNVPDVEKAIEGIASDIKCLESVDNIDQLRGYEGIGAARYFPALGQLIINPAFNFSLRHRQPPTDPVNSLLSFGYTLLFNNILSLIIAEGLSPYFGNLHYGEKPKPYLAFDLMEEFRSLIVDPLVLKIINKPFLQADDFELSAINGGVYLTNSGRRTFLNHFEGRLNEMISYGELQSPVSYRQVIQLQIRRYKQSLLSNITYKAFVRDI